MHWTPIDTNIKLAGGVRLHWSESAVDCLNFDKNCHVCPNHQVTGMNWTSHTCLMPITVQALVDKNIPIHERSFYRNAH
jgi:hypothetical protein